MTKLAKIHAREILDSRGNPTVEVEVTTESGVMGVAAVPSGASTGKREALELRDGEKNRYLGKGVKKAVQNVNTQISELLRGQNIHSLQEIDQAMIAHDGSENKENLGANAMLGVSMAVARAGALDRKKPLFQYLREDLNAPHLSSDFIFPAPLMNIINGGEHASNNLDIQEFMIVPSIDASFAENLRAGVEIFHHLKKVLHERGHSTNVGDEGGFAPNLGSHEEALNLILEAIEKAGYRPGENIGLSLDAAASEFYRDGSYQMEGRALSSEEMIEYYQKLVSHYPIYSIEDGLAEDDHQGWTKLTGALGAKTKLVGDDLFVTNKKIFAKGIANKEANAILVKVNQIGTLTETFETIALAKENDFVSIISHRSGETADHFIADLAVATSVGHIKTGSASRSDRLAKYNQLLRIEESLSGKGKFFRIL